MWSADNGPYRGRHYQLDETLNVPQALRQPHPPILIGGGGEQRTLRLVARYADACNLFTSEGPQGVAHKLAVLRRHCLAEGRNYAAIEKTILYLGPLPAATAHAAFIDEMRAYHAIGVERVMVMPGVATPATDVAALAPVIAALAVL